MRIDEIHVYGFGQLQSVSYLLQDGLNVVEGLNEAGKTTLMAFIRGVLFGFESRRYPERRYQPVEGGKFGGALVLTDGDGVTYRVERIYRHKVAGDVTVQLPDGGEAGEAFLNQLLNKLDEKVFKNIFAFGLSELAQIDALQGDEINQFIYTAGTGDGNVIRDVQKKLTEKGQALFRPHGSKAKINVKLQALREARQQLHECQQEHRQYAQLVTQLQALDQQIAAEEALIERRQRDIGRQERWLACYDDYVHYVSLQDQLAALPQIDHFPEDGVVQLQSLQDTEREWRVQLTDLQEDQHRLQEQLQRIAVNEAILQCRVDIADLRDKLNSYREHKEQAESCLLNSRREQERLTVMIEQLGSAWTENKLSLMDTSVVTKQTVRHFADDLGTLKAAVALVVSERDAARNDYRQQQIKLDEWQSREPARSVKSGHALEEERRELERVRDLGQQQFVMESRMASLREQIKQYADTQAAVVQTSGGHASAAWKWGWLSLAIVLPLGLWVFKQPLAAGITFILLMSQTMREFVYKGGTRSSNDYMANDLQQKKQAAASELSRLQTDYDDLRSEVEQIARRFDRESSDVNEWSRQWEQEWAALRQWEHWQEQHDDKQWQLGQVRTVVEQVEQRWEQAHAAYQEKLTEWQAWMSLEQWMNDDGTQTLSPELVLEMMRDVEAARETLRRIAELQSARERHEQFSVRYLETLQSVLTRTDIQLSTPDPEFQVRELNELLAQATEAKRRKKSLTEQLDAVTAAIRSVEHRLHEQAEVLTELLKGGGVTDVETFRLRAEQYRERKRLEQECKPLYRALRRVGQEQYEQTENNAVNDLLADMSKTSKLALTDKLRSLQEAQTASRERMKALRHERAALSVKIEHLATGTELSEQRMRFQQLVTDLQQDAESWAVIALGEHLLQRAMDVYEREKQPGVLKQASCYLQEMTEGRYNQVLAPIGHQAIEVVRQDGRRFEPAYLSRGTVEQLYLAMRFALVEAYGNQILLPMVLDDIFVNFDPGRTRAAIRTLKSVAANRQVLFFTCHTHICALFDEAAAPHRIKLTTPISSLQQV